jgi:protoheme IX farnesyltransferase
MRRTMGRPLPSGRLAPGDALAFGVLLCLGGLAYTVMLVNTLTAVLGLLTVVSYLLAYTPLKTRTSLCTIVGAVPGALPPMMGYAAATGAVDARAWALFAILFVWQMPHFLAIAWLYREDYARGGQMMLPVVDPTGRTTARHMVIFSLTLLPVTLAPTLIGMAGLVYFAGAAVLGIVFFGFGALVAASRTLSSARQMFIVSVLYLPLLLGLMVLDRM